METFLKTLHYYIIALGAIISGIAGANLPVEGYGFPYLGAVIGIVLWAILYIRIGWKVVGQKTVIAIERFGVFSGIKQAGPRILCFPGLIDIIKGEPITLAAWRIKLYVNDEGNPDTSMAIDFVDGSAPINAEVWVILDDTTSTGENVKKFRYNTTNPEEYVETVCNAAIRPKLQALTINDARTKKEEVAREMANDPDIETALKAIGLRLYMPKGILIQDIILPQALEDLQSLALKGTKEREMAVNKAVGYASVLHAIIKEAEEHKIALTWDEAKEIYFENRRLEAFENSSVNPTFIGQDIASMVASLSGRRNP